MFTLRIPKAEIGEYALRYDYPLKDEPIRVSGAKARDRGFVTQDEFLEIALWKSRRPGPLFRRNSADFIKEVTAASLASSDPRFKVEVLCLLDGVSWPVASVFLHFCDRERWPIVDFRAFWSLGQGDPKYSPDIWRQYVEYTRQLADDVGLDMRTLDRALWAYSKQHQPPRA